MPGFLKYQLYQQHIAECPPGDGEQHVALPQVQPGRDEDCDQLRDTVTAGEKIDIFQAVDHQHPKDCRWQRLAEVLDVARRGPLVRKEQEGQKSRGHRPQCTDGDGDNLLCQRHDRPPALSIGLRKTVSRQRMHAIVGIMNESAPKHSRHTAETTTPISAV